METRWHRNGSALGVGVGIGIAVGVGLDPDADADSDPEEEERRRRSRQKGAGHRRSLRTPFGHFSMPVASRTVQTQTFSGFAAACANSAGSARLSGSWR